MIAPPSPCTARATSSATMLPAAALAAEASVKRTTPTTKTRLRPSRSAIEPAVRTTEASARVYASTTHWSPERPASRSSAMCPRAVLTTAMSSMRIAVASAATASVPFLLISCSCSRASLHGGASEPGVARELPKRCDPRCWAGWTDKGSNIRRTRWGKWTFVGNHRRVPLPLRPSLDEQGDAGRATPPTLTAPERHALNLIAEQARERACLEHVWILARLPDRGGAEDALTWVAHAASEDAGEIPAAAVKAVAMGAMRGGPRRFVRRTARTGGGVNVVAVETRADRMVSVVTSAPENAKLGPETEAALADLADVAARMLAGGSELPRQER